MDDWPVLGQVVVLADRKRAEVDDVQHAVGHDEDARRAVEMRRDRIPDLLSHGAPGDLAEMFGGAHRNTGQKRMSRDFLRASSPTILSIRTAGPSGIARIDDGEIRNAM